MSKKLKKINKMVDELRDESKVLETGIKEAMSSVEKLRPVYGEIQLTKKALKETLVVVGEDLDEANDYQRIVKREQVLADQIREKEAYLSEARPRFSEIRRLINNLHEGAILLEYFSIEAKRFAILHKSVEKGSLSSGDEKKLKDLNSQVAKFTRPTGRLTNRLRMYMDKVSRDEFGILDIVDVEGL